jgi:hypothetical protein
LIGCIVEFTPEAKGYQVLEMQQTSDLMLLYVASRCRIMRPIKAGQDNTSA